jgi:hypothetical protein
MGGVSISNYTVSNQLLLTSTTSQGISAFSGGNLVLPSGTYLSTGSLQANYVFTSRLDLVGDGYTPSFRNVSNMTLTSSTTPAIDGNTYGTFYYITNSAFNTLVLPSSYIIGQHWIFRNATTTYLSVNVTYTGSGGGGVSTLTFPPLNTITIMFASNTSGSAAYAFF